VKLKDALLIARLFLSGGKAAVTAAIEYQSSVLKVACVLPDGKNYQRVEAAVRACGVHPAMLYEIAARGEPLPVAFREALYGPDYSIPTSA
jgi:hypothetical protein